MKLPVSLENSKIWSLVGPMGPALPEKLLAHSVLGVDGGARFCSRMDLWVGDGDSYLETVKCENIYRFPADKATSDLALALTFFKTSDSVVLHCWGFLGGRKDHEILNFGEVLHFLDNTPRSEVHFYQTDGQLALKCLASGVWNFEHQGTFSLASIKNIKIKIEGACLYPLTSETELPPLSSLGLSNVAKGKFTLTNNGPVMIFFPGPE
ncbi:MAG: hypothetical protein H0V66_08740 [Bdellovibrionales bacterium]|nr:hypothetical protein [Bdellovibrionales bacterium]